MIRMVGPITANGDATYNIPVEVWRWFRWQPRVLRGGGTVFHYYPSGDRANTRVEFWAYDRIIAHEWNGGHL